MVECRDGLARITSKELAITHPAKDGILLNVCSTRTRMVAVLGEKCSFAHRQVDTQPTKWSKSNNDKSAVALLKKGDWHERESVTSRYHDSSGRPDCKRGKSWDEIHRNVNYLMHDIGLRISGHDAAEVYSPEEH